jgi:hypothetical protein
VEAQQLLATLQFAPRCPDRDLRTSLAELVAYEVAARQSNDWASFQTLIHPDADPQWRSRQQDLETGLTAVDLVRITEHTAPQSVEWAHAAVVETYENEQVYTTRTFKQDAFGCWRLMSPSSDAVMGNNGTMTISPSPSLHIMFSEFDEPYARAVAPRLQRVLERMVADFAVELPEDFALVLVVTPVPFAAQDELHPPSMARVYVPSPLNPGFPIGRLAQSPEEYLLGYATDLMGHALLQITYGEQAAEPARLALAHPAVQWEVDQAVAREHTALLAANLTDVPAPLDALLDPARPLAGDSLQPQRELFFRFAVAEYGREIIAPYLAAVHSSETAAALSLKAFGEPLSTVQTKWHAWLAHQRAAAGAP